MWLGVAGHFLYSGGLRWMVGCRGTVFMGGWGWVGVSGGIFLVVVVGWTFSWVDGAGWRYILDGWG